MSLRQVPFWLLIIVVASLYFFTLPGDVYLEDSGEFTAAACFLGIAHPSGYPLYLVIGKLFCLLPFGTEAFRLNLDSAVFGLATAVMIFLACAELAKIFGRNDRLGNWLAFGLAVLFALSRDFWSQAIIAEVYTLNAFLVGLVIWVFLKWWQKRETKYVLWLAFLSGLGLTNHPLFVFILPALWAVSGERLAGEKITWKRVLELVGLFLLGTSVYFYIPIRASFEPVINFNHIHGLLESLGHVFRSYYNDVSLIGMGRRWGFVWGFGELLIANFTPFLALGMLGGLVYLLIKRQIELFLLLCGGFAFSVLLPILMRNAEYGVGADFTYRVYYFQAYLLGIILAFGFFNAFGNSRKYILAGLLVLVALLGVKNFLVVNLRFSPVAAYYEAKLKSFPPQTVYLSLSKGYDNDSELFIFLYLQEVKSLRPDVRIIDASRLFYIPSENFAVGDWGNLAFLRIQFLKHLVKEFGLANPLYTSFPVEAYSQSLVSRPNGFAIEVLEKGQLKPQIESIKRINIPVSHPRLAWDLAYQDFLAADAYQQALYWEFIGDRPRSVSELKKALQYDNEINSQDYQAFRRFREVLTQELDNTR